MFIKKMLALLGFAVGFLGCNNPMPYKERIMKPGPVTIFQVAQQPTAPADRKDGIQYKSGFQVTGTATFSTGQSEGLRKAMLSARNYSATDSRRCVFVPGYYLQLDTAFGLLLAKEPCSKIMFAHEDKDTIIDLVNDNSIEKIVGEMWKGR